MDMADTADLTTPESAAEARRPPKPSDMIGRFRDIVCDPLNLLIERAPLAGVVEDGLVWLHNGARAPIEGPGAYYGEFSQILVINRGVHEPLEEFIFQEMLRRMPTAPLMLELGAYWGHYSMWLKRLRPQAVVFLVEPKWKCLRAGQQNFELNGLEGEFIQAFVGHGQFQVDAFMAEQALERLNVLHADIQGYELEMLDGAAACLDRRAADYVFISTHGQKRHRLVLDRLQGHGYRIEVSSDFLSHSTSHDGLVFATSPDLEPLFSNFEPLGREDICASAPGELVDYLTSLRPARPT